MSEPAEPRPRQFHLGEPIPHVLTKRELAAITRCSLSQIDVFRRARTHPGIKQLDGPGHPRFCGKTVKAWLDGGSPEPMRRRFFGTHTTRVAR